MAIVKIHTIKKTPDKGLKYIVNPEKTKDGILVTGINTVSNPKLAHIDMKNMRERYSMKRLNKCFHFVHSFNSRDNITAEQVHEFTLDWCKRVFGDKAQYVVATHDDQKHKHSHIIINNVNILGQSMDFTKTWLYNAKRTSNDICYEQGLVYSIVKGKTSRRHINHYKEDLEIKKGTSWKEAIRKELDLIVVKSNNMDQLISFLNAKGYTFKEGKTGLMIKPPNKDRYVSLHRLGTGYSKYALETRINRLNDYPKLRRIREEKIDILNGVLHTLTVNEDLALKQKQLQQEFFSIYKSQDPVDKTRCKEIKLETTHLKKVQDFINKYKGQSLDDVINEAEKKSSKQIIKQKEVER